MTRLVINEFDLTLSLIENGRRRHFSTSSCSLLAQMQFTFTSCTSSSLAISIFIGIIQWSERALAHGKWPNAIISYMTRLIYCLISLYYIYFHRFFFFPHTIVDYTCLLRFSYCKAHPVLFLSRKLAARAATLFYSPLFEVHFDLFAPSFSAHFDCVAAHYRSIGTSVSVDGEHTLSLIERC